MRGRAGLGGFGLRARFGFAHPFRGETLCFGARIGELLRFRLTRLLLLGALALFCRSCGRLGEFACFRFAGLLLGEALAFLRGADSGLARALMRRERARLCCLLCLLLGAARPLGFGASGGLGKLSGFLTRKPLHGNAGLLFFRALLLQFCLFGLLRALVRFAGTQLGVGRRALRHGLRKRLRLTTHLRIAFLLRGLELGACRFFCVARLTLSTRLLEELCR
ncbi:MAG: hypothetical protein J0I75_11210, partial [Hyphomicrobium sp.]|nr:hypothetical protein [Hyphomicrobium sp.]